MDKYSYLSNAEVGYLDQLYQSYKKDPAAVDISWQKFFEGFEFSRQQFVENGHTANGTEVTPKETQVRNLIFAYRSFGHLK
jgi:2-oxoglutarate dehydrogenase E1 component